MAGNNARTLKSWQAFFIAIGVLTAGFVWTTFFKEAPYGVFAPAVVGLAGGYWAKRTIQRSEKYGGFQPPPDGSGESGGMND